MSELWIADCGCKIKLENVRVTEKGVEIGSIKIIEHCSPVIQDPSGSPELWDITGKVPRE